MAYTPALAAAAQEQQVGQSILRHHVAGMARLQLMSLQWMEASASSSTEHASSTELRSCLPDTSEPEQSL